MSLDETTAALLGRMSDPGRPKIFDMTPHDLQAMEAQTIMHVTEPDMLRVFDRKIAIDESTETSVRVLVPSENPKALVIYFHGGGWMLGSVDACEGIGRALASRLNATVILVAYRRTPDHPFPAALDDAWAAVQWASGMRSTLAAADAPLIVAGDSAGANLATVTARRARDNGASPSIDAQLLFYPVTDHDLDRSGYHDEDKYVLLDRDMMAYFWNHYVPDPADRAHPDASPLKAENLAGMPPTVLATAEYDVLCEEGEDYAGRLAQAGVDTRSRRFDSQTHGFVQMVGLLPGAQVCLDWAAQEVADVLGLDRASAAPSAGRSDVDVVIVGAGFSGMYQLNMLRDRGFSTRVFEKGEGIGGTWYWNRYPGARCDVDSIYYSYSWSAELDQDWSWSERYAAQPEILRYAQHVAERFDLTRDITLSTVVTRMWWDEENSLWHTETDTGEHVTSRYVILATGVLSHLKDPKIDGLHDFSGDVLSTGRWPHEGYDFAGKRVAVVGTGSTGIQAIPVIAETAAELTVYQRTPSYAMPARNRPLTPDEIAAVKAQLPEQREKQRWSPAGMLFPTGDKGAREVTAEEREAAYEAAWESGGLATLGATFNDQMTSKESNDLVSDFVHRKIKSIVKDPEIANALCPTTYGLMTRRPCLATNYYETYNLPHVTLVDLTKTPIEKVTTNSVVTSGGTRDHDVIVLATGYDGVTGAALAINPEGRDGRKLSEAWADGPYSLLGMMVAGFPNMFTITGPLGPGILSNIIVCIEQNVEWVTDALVALREQDAETFEADASAQAEWAEMVDQVAHMTLYPTTKSWFNGDNVEGKPRVFMAWAGGVDAYRQICIDVVADGYRGFSTVRSPAALVGDRG